MKKNKANKRTSPSDRRQKNIKGFAPEKRTSLRRKEDKNNIFTYYLVLAFTLFLLAAFGIASFCYTY